MYRPTTDTKFKLFKDISKICENSRILIRQQRHLYQKCVSNNKRFKKSLNDLKYSNHFIDDHTKQSTKLIDDYLDKVNNLI